MSEIPPFFHSLEHDEPFSTCLTCHRAFQEIDDPYTVTKVFKGPECVFEYAMCLPCRRKLAESLSQESRQAMTTFFDNSPHFAKRTERLAENEDHREWTRECATCATPLTDLKDYSVACMGFGDHMVYEPFPMMVCSQCEESLQSNFSKSSRDQWDKFIFDHFEGPPAGAIKIDRVPILV